MIKPFFGVRISHKAIQTAELNLRLNVPKTLNLTARLRQSQHNKVLMCVDQGLHCFY